MGEIRVSIRAKISDFPMRLLKMLNFCCVRLFTFQDEILKKLLLVRGAASSPIVPLFWVFLFKCQEKMPRGGFSKGQVCIEGCAKPLARGMCKVIFDKNILCWRASIQEKAN